jgi:hypothetical protein
MTDVCLVGRKARRRVDSRAVHWVVWWAAMRGRKRAGRSVETKAVRWGAYLAVVWE